MNNLALESQWKRAYQAARDAIFEKLSTDEREMILAAPDGWQSGDLARRASDAANFATNPNAAAQQVAPKGRWT